MLPGGTVQTFDQPRLRRWPAKRNPDPRPQLMEDVNPSLLLQPLLYDSEDACKSRISTSNAVFALSKAIIGAGMMAIPRAINQIGFILGTSMLLGVALLTYYTLAALVRGSSAAGATTYSQLALLTCGRPVMKLLQLAVLAFCFGFGVASLVVIRDLLLGTPPSCNGLLCEVLGLSPSSALADPRLVLAAVALIFCAPLLMLRSLDKLAVLNMVGVVAVMLVALISAGLGLQGLVTGTSTPLPAYPQWDLLGPSRVQQVEALTAVVPVLIACYVAHQSLHPLMPLVKPYSDAKMKQVVALALMITFVVYITLAAGVSLMFGNSIQVNVLNNFSVSGLQPLVGAVPARVISWSIRGGYLISLLGSIVLYMPPMRGCIAEMLWQEHHIGQAAAATGPAALQTSVEAAQTSKAGAVDLERGCCSSDVVVAVEKTATYATQGKAWLSQQRCPAGDCIWYSSCGPVQQRGTVASVNHALKEGACVNNTAGPTCCATLACKVATDTEDQWGCQADHVQPVRKVNQQWWQQQEQRYYYALTYGLLTSMVLVAVLASNIWVVLSAVGDLASTMQAFVVPGLISLALVTRYKAATTQLSHHQYVCHSHPHPADSSADASSSSNHSMALNHLNPDHSNIHHQFEADGCNCIYSNHRGWFWLLDGFIGSCVVVLGLALFANGLYERLM